MMARAPSRPAPCSAHCRVSSSDNTPWCCCPPDALAAPWSYLAVVLVAAVVATVVAVKGQGYGSKEWAARELRAGR